MELIFGRLITPRRMDTQIEGMRWPASFRTTERASDRNAIDRPADLIRVSSSNSN
jgi:hypothetical protein